MKLLKTVSIILFMVAGLCNQAHTLNFDDQTSNCNSPKRGERRHIFIGQSENNGVTKAIFSLELLVDDIENNILINEKGEVYLKADKIIAIPKEGFSHPANLGQVDVRNSFAQEFSEISKVAAGNSALTLNAIPDGYWQCPICRRWYQDTEISCSNTRCPLYGL